MQRTVPTWLRASGLLHYVLVITLGWTLTIAGLLWLDQRHRESTGLALAKTYAKAAYEKDLIYRRWNAAHGGVYVPVTEATVPNVYLDAPEREVTTPSGRVLTLVNPAYMTRQVHEMAASATGMHAHLTSLHPVNPRNAPDAWERSALESFERGAEDATALWSRSGTPHMRLMMPLPVEEGCLACHAAHGYRVGDVRGGISVSVPVEEILAHRAAQSLAASAGYGTVWLIGVLGITAGGLRLRRRVAEKERAEGSLQVSEERFRAIFEKGPLGIATATTDEMVLDVNEALCRMLGYRREELVGKPNRNFTDPEDYQQEIQSIQRLLHGESPVHRMDKRLIHKEGHRVWCRVTAAPVRDESGTIRYAIATVEDISDQKAAEAAIREAKHAAEAASRAKSEFLANVSHEIRTPMTAILGFADILLDNVQDPESVDAARTIQRNGGYLLEIINGILDLSKIEAGRFQVDRILCSPADIVDDVLALMRVRADAKNLPLRVH